MRAVFDHVVVDVRDRLEEAAAACEQLGFSVTSASENSLGSINRLCVFDAGYLELLAVGPRATGEQRGRMANPVGANGLVFRTEDVPATKRDLHERGIETGVARSFARPVFVEGACERARFETLHVYIPGADPLRSYFCRHETPGYIWQPVAMQHPNGATSIRGVTLAASEPNAVGAWFARAFDECVRAADRWVLKAGAQIAVGSREAVVREFGMEAAADTRACAIHVLTVVTTDLAAAERFARSSGRRTNVGPQSIVVDAGPGVNLLFAFVGEMPENQPPMTGRC